MKGSVWAKVVRRSLISLGACAASTPGYSPMRQSMRHQHGTEEAAFPRRGESRSRVVNPCASHADGLASVNIHSFTKQFTMTLQPVCTLIVFRGITNNLYGDPTCVKFCRQQPCLASSPFRSPLLLNAAINPQRRTKVQRLRALLRRRRTQPPGKKLPIRAA